MTTPKTIEDVLEEHVKSLFPQITYVDRSHKAFKQALTTIETIMSERVIGEDNPHSQPCQYAKDTMYEGESADNFCMCLSKQMNYQKATQRQNLKHVIYGEKE